MTERVLAAAFLQTATGTGITGKVPRYVAEEDPDMRVKMLDIFVESGKITESWGYWPDKQTEMLLQAP